MAVRYRYSMVFALAALFASGCDEATSPLGANEGQPAARPGQGADSEARGMRDSYIVLLRQDGGDVAQKIGMLKARHGRFVEDNVYRHALQGFSARLPSSLMRKLAADPDVVLVEKDLEVRAVSQETPWGITHSGAAASSTAAGNGSGQVSGVRIYILDTGIQPTHPDLNVQGGINFSGRKQSDWSDRNGHGTHVAGTAAARDNGSHVVGIAPGAPLYAVKVLGDNGSGYLSNVVRGVDWVVSHKGATPKIVNMSLGAYSGTAETSLDIAVRSAIEQGVVFAIAAGNDSRDAALYSPAHVSEAITVGAYAISSTFAGFSNYGAVVDILAPGVGILSTWVRSSTATISGTSMAAPHVAGAAALYLSQNAGATPAQVRNALVDEAGALAGTTPGQTTDATLNVSAF